MDELKDILGYFPIRIRQRILENINPSLSDFLEEIRIRLNRPICLKIGQEIMTIEYIVKTQEVEEIFTKICENSIYSYRNEICEGFLTIRGGHRIGITGTVIMNEKTIKI